ncbi:FHA domain-containing protein FhaB [Anaerolineae bacterium]|nr:FHA domain-containing protein FhaB [Anaerolineae bacterium]
MCLGGDTVSGKLALIIGNSHYQDPNLAKLAAPAEDATDLAETLHADQIGGFDVTTLIDASAADLHKTIAKFFANRKYDDLLVLYFSGHGVLDDQGQLFFAASDTDRDLLSGTAVPASFVKGEMDRCRSKRQVLILDCCHSGAFARGAKGDVGATVGTATAFNAGEGYARAVLTATDATQYAWEGDQVIGEADNSLFTHFLIQGLQTGDADADGDGHITLQELYDYVEAQVRLSTSRQKPLMWALKEQGQLIIAQNPRAGLRPVDLPIELRTAIENPLPAAREAAARQLDGLLNGPDLGLAMTAFDALKGLTSDDSRSVRTIATTALTVIAERLQAATAGSDAARLAEALAQREKLAAQRAEAERLAQQKAEAERAAEAARAARDRLKTDPATQANAARFHLVTAAGQKIALKAGDNLLGRADDVEIPITNTLASRRHAVICVEAQRVTIQDLDSANGTFVNGQKIGVSAVALKPGDTLTLGDTVLKFRAAQTEPVRPTVDRALQQRPGTTGRSGAGGQSVAAQPMAAADPIEPAAPAVSTSTPWYRSFIGMLILMFVFAPAWAVLIWTSQQTSTVKWLAVGWVVVWFTVILPELSFLLL